MLTRHIFLVGMPGCGKSSLGRRMSNEMGLSFLDADGMIGEVLGGAVNDVFAKYGEETFRRVETNLLCWIVRQPPCIVSTGGGMVTREVNRNIMRNHGFILFIDRPIDEIVGDIKLDRRPNLADKGLEGVRELYDRRIGIYRAAADLTIDNGHGYYAGMEALRKGILRLCPNA